MWETRESEMCSNPWLQKLWAWQIFAGWVIIYISPQVFSQISCTWLFIFIVFVIIYYVSENVRDQLWMVFGKWTRQPWGLICGHGSGHSSLGASLPALGSGCNSHCHAASGRETEAERGHWLAHFEVGCEPAAWPLLGWMLPLLSQPEVWRSSCWELSALLFLLSSLAASTEMIYSVSIPQDLNNDLISSAQRTCGQGGSYE